MGPEKYDVIVVGGGISGLCTAHWLSRRGFSVTVLEKGAEAGGTMQSVHEDGFLVETGPNSALETTPLIRQLVDELSLGSEFVYADPSGNRRYILRNGTLHALPLTPQGFVMTRLFSAKAKLRLFREPFIGRADHEESIAEFVRRRLGNEFLDYAIDPFVAGVYAARPDQLSVRAAFPKLYALEERYGGLIRGMIAGRKERKARPEQSKDRAQSFSFRSGMQVLPRALADGLGDGFRSNAIVTEIEDQALETNAPSDEPGFRRYKITFLDHGQSRELESDVVILSIPAYAAAPLVQHLSPEGSHALSRIPYPPVASVFFGFERASVGHPLDGFGFLVPSKEERKILGCLWSSSLFPGRAPQGHVGVTAFVGGGRQPDIAGLDEMTLTQLVLDELKNIMEITGKPVYCRITQWAHAIPQYELGYQTIADGMELLEDQRPGLFLCGNFRGGIAVGDCIKNASSVVERAEQFLQSRPIDA